MVLILAVEKTYVKLRIEKDKEYKYKSSEDIYIICFKIVIFELKKISNKLIITLVVGTFFIFYFQSYFCNQELTIFVQILTEGVSF